MFWGIFVYWSTIAAVAYWNWSFCLIYILFPLFEAIIFLSAIAYLWHAYVDSHDPTNQYVNSITILEGHDNIWNEDYHVVHHHSPSTHWTLMADHYEKNVEKYKEN